jgi:peptide/nickel transport system substrate-binding protein
MTTLREGTRGTGTRRVVPPGRRLGQLLVACLAGLALAAASCGGSDGGTTTGKPKRGGSITVLEEAAFAGSWPTGLDPATNTNGAANQMYMNSIYGQLFRLDEKGRIQSELATGSKFEDGGKTVKIGLRKGVKFTDGTPFDAKAVAFNIRRDLKSDCTCRPTWPVKSITTEGTHTLVLNFIRPFAAVIPSFIDSNANWTVSPTALKKMGERRFRVKPVGAGPFKVVSNKLSSELVLKRNPTYWKRGRPYLDKLTFKTIGGDQAGYQALLAGQAHAYEGMSTPKLIEQASKGDRLQVTQQVSTSPYFLQLNTTVPPFDDKRAREAIYYASDSEAIRSHLFDNRYKATQGFTGPGGLFYEPKIEGYRTYDLRKARALVKELGGLKVDLGTLNVLVAKQTIQALQSQWAKAGIKTEIESYDLPGLVRAFQSKKWQALLQTAGSFDPAQGVGVRFRLESVSPFSGIKDEKLDAMLGKASATLDQGARKKLYTQIAKYVSDQAYGPFFFAFAPANLAVKGVSGPGLTTAMPAVVVNVDVFWDEVWVSGEGT